jgi:hypothetical protein
MSQVQNQQTAEQDKTRPWWRYPIVWMVIGGPAAVVVASIYTAGLAIKHVDPVLDTSVGQVSSPSEAPAMKARNHAAETAQAPADK